MVWSLLWCLQLPSRSLMRERAVRIEHLGGDVHAAAGVKITAHHCGAIPQQGVTCKGCRHLLFSRFGSYVLAEARVDIVRVPHGAQRRFRARAGRRAL